MNITLSDIFPENRFLYLAELAVEHCDRENLTFAASELQALRLIVDSIGRPVVFITDDPDAFILLGRYVTREADGSFTWHLADDAVPEETKARVQEFVAAYYRADLDADDDDDDDYDSEDDDAACDGIGYLSLMLPFLIISLLGMLLLFR